MEIIKAIFGSHLYGTNVENSDKDYKFLFLPEGRDIVLQRASKNVQQNTKSSSAGVRNTSEDIDCEGFSLQQWFKMLTEGQTLAVEMLFIPKKFQIGECYLPIWDEIQANRHRLVSKKISPFVGYCRAQASKYSVKTERLQAAKLCIDALSSIERYHDRLEEYLPLLIDLVSKNEFIEIQYGQEKHSDNWFSCCGRKTPLTATCKRALDLYEGIYAEYGARARLAAEGGSIDWKAVYHSLRIAYEAVELLSTGNITLPRPEAPLLLEIRKGLIPYARVSGLVEQKVLELEEVLLTTDLMECADYAWIEDFVFHWHMEMVKKC